MRHLRPILLPLRFATILALLGSFTFVGAQKSPEIIFSYPPGALAVFQGSIYRQDQPIRKIYLRAEGSADVWAVDATPVLVPPATADASQKAEMAIGFLVPQLSKGRYLAWYEPPRDAAQQSMKLEIVPQLLGDVGITRGAPGSDVEVAIRIFTSHIERRDGVTAPAINPEITLSSSDPTIANLVTGQASTITGNREGTATWRVHIHRPGIARLVATAKEFEPTMVFVVGMPSPAPTFLEAALQEAEPRARRLEAAAQEAKGLAQRAREALDRQQQEGAAASAADANKRTRDFEARVEALNKAADAKSIEAANARNEVVALTTQLAAQPRRFTEADLKPGDILLVRGSTPFVSSSISQFETTEFKSEAPYSHAAIYLGQVNGSGKVAEMLLQGFYVTSLKESIKSCLLVDVYRLEGISDAKRDEIARRAAQPFGPGIGSGSPIPYAVSQINVLAYLAAMRISLLGTFLSNVELRALVKLADEFAGGRRKMICSELVAWIYNDVGLALDVTHWKRFTDLNLLTTEDRRKDYTTPNMLARSRSLHLVGRYLGP